jgi:DNA-binding XRE family transcriptional regulator
MKDEPLLNQLNKVVKVKKKTINQKKKGKRGESWFADKLSDITGHHFHRIYSSGASVGKSNNSLLEELTQEQAQAQLGDIQSPDIFKHYFIWEAKNYKDLDFHNMLKPDKISKTVEGWIEELEYDIQSAFSLMKNNTKPIAGFLTIKVTRIGNWIIGNLDYLEKLFNISFKFDNVLFFNREPNEELKKFGFGNKYFMTDFETWIIYNKESLFIEDLDKIERLKKAKEAFDKIYNGEL